MGFKRSFPRSRGAKQGRGGSRKGGSEPRGPKFQGQRLDENDVDETAEILEQEEDDDDDDHLLDAASLDDDDDDDDAIEGTTAQSARPYLALLQSFSESTPPRPKTSKRKLQHHDTKEGRKKRKREMRTTGQQDQQHGDEALGQQDGDGPQEQEDIDHVEEAEEEDPSAEMAEQSDSEDEMDATDPFDTHFASPDEATTSRRIKAIETSGWEMRNLTLPPSSSPHKYKVLAMLPKTPAAGSNDESDDPPPETTVPIEPIRGTSSLKLKQKLKSVAATRLAKLDPLQQALAPMVFGYVDVLFCERTVRNADSLRKLVCLHALNHVLKTRDRVIKNSARLAKDADLDLRDQGFTRPKVLFLVPTRNAALRTVNALRDLCSPDQEENRKRFDDAFGSPDDSVTAVKFGADKPDDFRDLFAGNDDDMFRLSVKLTRKTIKYYAQFYNSDMILASPLGLRMALGSDDTTANFRSDRTKNKKTKAKLEYDFLSSIELVVVDQADALLMQNWEHVASIFEHLNLQPRDAHGCDFGRVRPWYLDNHAKFFRQTVVLSAFHAPELAELARATCHNWAGKLRVQPAAHPGVMAQLANLGVRGARQTFSRFLPSSLAAEPDTRFAYFTTAVLPGLARRASDAQGTLVFVPSYLDFVRLRNYLSTSPDVSSLSFGLLSEYLDVPTASRARSHFVTGRHKLLLYTERAHHFRRYRIKGVRRVLFYGLPENPAFYADIAAGYLAASQADGTLEPERGASVRVVFSKYDVHKLERVVGTERVARMLGDKGDTFDFV